MATRTALPGHVPRARTPIEANSIDALFAFCSRSLVGFFGRRGHAGSGTLVAIGEDVVVATAGHVVEAVDADTRLRLLGDGAELTEFNAGAAGTLLPGADVGLVKLTGPACTRARSFALSLSSLLSPQRPLALFSHEHQHAHGFPASLPNAALTVNTVLHLDCPHGHPAAEARSPPLPMTHGLHLDWSGHQAAIGVAANPAPPGMSGGALWTVEKTEDGLWSPQRNAKLAGILFFSDVPDCIRAEPIDAWRALAAASVPEWAAVLGA